MSSNSHQFSQRFASLTVREQRLVVGTFLLLLWGGWDNFYYQPAMKKQEQLENEIKQLEHQNSLLQQLSLETEHASISDPNGKNREHLSTLNTSIDNLKKQLTLGEKRFVPSHLMAAALRDIIKQDRNLQLISLETLPTRPYGTSDQALTWIYRHSMVITLKGDYFSTLGYLKALEALPWRIHWDQIDLQVKDHPISETRIQVYTLSFEQDWLSV